MSHLEAVRSYYEAWMAGKGDFRAVPLAPDFAFTGPVASFDAEILQVRDGQLVCGELIYDAQELRAAMAAGA